MGDLIGDLLDESLEFVGRVVQLLVAGIVCLVVLVIGIDALFFGSETQEEEERSARVPIEQDSDYWIRYAEQIEDSNEDRDRTYSQNVNPSADYVNGYYRRDGTYVAPHYRSSQNNFRSDNYTHRGNTNPFNGKRGYRGYGR